MVVALLGLFGGWVVRLAMGQRFTYGLWQLRSVFLSTKAKAGYEAEILLAAVHPP